MINNSIYSSDNQFWKTPDYVFEHLDKEFDFEGDPCPVKPLFDGLEIEWSDMNFVNPPYKEISKWIDKAIFEQAKNHYSVFLIPSRTDTKWFIRAFCNCTEIRFVIGRIKFVGANNSAPFPSMIVYFGPRPELSSPKIPVVRIPKKRSEK